MAIKDDFMKTQTPVEKLVAGLSRSKLVKFYQHAAEAYRDLHLKELDVDSVGPAREMQVKGHDVINFGFDSFLGLDQDVRVKDALIRGAHTWGTQFGASRAFASCHAEVELETKIAQWMGTEAAIIYPSVTLANVGALPGLVEPEDLIVVDQFAHNSIVEGTKIARANGVRVLTFAHNDPADLERVLTEARPYRYAVIAIDGVYSMSGAIPPMAEFNEIAHRHDGILYVDDAHATAVLGAHGRGTVLETLGSYDNTLVVGCLSKACSVFGAFIACTHPVQRLLKMRSNTYIFGGPIPPPYLEAVSTVIDILASDDYAKLRDQLDLNIQMMVSGLRRQDLVILGGDSPIVSVLVGDEEAALKAGKMIFDRGYYVQSVTFPAVPFRGAILRVQVNANHRAEDILGLVHSFGAIKSEIAFPSAQALAARDAIAMKHAA